MTENTINNDMTMGGATGALLAGRYRVVKQLGQGGMGSVWLAEDTKLDGFKVAIKMLPSVLVNNKRAYAQVKAEALVSLKLSHPNIVAVRAFEEENGNPFLVMDYIDGQTLDDYLAEKGKLTEEETVKLLKPVAAALDYAHTQGVVHRDVKPGNIMIRKDGTPFVLDFGIAREIQETMTRVTGKLSSGTLLYMSPEQLNGDAPKPAQDIYSFAALVYECLTGAPPFVRGCIEDQIKNKKPEPLDPQFANCGQGVTAGLAKSPEARPRCCAAALSSGTRVTRSHTDGGGPTGTLRISVAWLGALLLIAALAGVLVILYRQTALNEADDQKLNVPAKRRLSPVSISGSSSSESAAVISNAVEKITENSLPTLQVQEQLKFYLQRADFVRAKPVAEKVLSNDAEDPAANFALGMFYFGSDVSKAEKYLTAVLTRKPKEIAVLNNLAMLQIRQKRFKEAADNLNKALELAPGHKAILDTLNQLKTAECNEESIRQVKDDTERNAAKKREREANRDDRDQTVNHESIKQVEQARILKAGDTKIITLPGGETMVMVWCPPGSFMMGSPTSDDPRDNDEVQHRVTLTQGFWMGVKEVSQGQWKSIMGTTVVDQARKALLDDTKYGGKTLRELWGMEKYDAPVKVCGDIDDDVAMYYVSWEEANKYCEKLTERERVAGRLPEGWRYHLPTEAQWEYACRAQLDSPLPNGMQLKVLGRNNAPALDGIAWYGGNSSVGFTGRGRDTAGWTEKQYPGGRAGPRKGGLKERNRFGLYDMIGNVWEWCADWYGDYPAGSVSDPTGPVSGRNRVDRGGGWYGDAQSCRSANRYGGVPGIRNDCLGFRLVCSRP